MGRSKRMGMGGKQSFVSLSIALSMVASLLSAAIANPAEAKSSRTAIVVEANGTVNVKKAGGSKLYTAYGDMSLNEGDVLITGESSSAVLKIADHEDEITIGDNSEISIAELSQQGEGKTSKIMSWAGSMWLKVKSLVSSEDEFEIETPTAVMGVRGTQVGTTVNPVTGETTTILASGRIEASTTANDGEGGQQQTKSTVILPSQQINLGSRDEVENLKTKVSILDLNKFVSEASPRLIEAIIRNKSSIDAENKEFIEKKKSELSSGDEADNGDSSLSIKDSEALDKVSQNLNNIVGNIAKIALAQNKLTSEQLNQIIAETNNQIADPTQKLDLDKVQDIDPSAGVDPELEKIKQDVLNKLAAKQQAELAAKLKLQQEQLAKLKDILDRVEQESKRVEEENKKAAEQAKQKAESEYSSKLSDEEKKRFEADKSKAKESTSATTPTTPTTPGAGSSTNSGKKNDNKPVSAPDVVLTQLNKDANTVTLQLSMANFPQAKEFYAVEAHLVYNNTLSYKGPKELTDVPNTVFESADKSAETLRQVTGTTQSELIYAASLFEASNSTAAVNNITVDGTKALVDIPLTFAPAATGSMNVDLVYVKVVNKSGATVAEFTTPKSITVTK